jgi:hypothetical protein
MNDYAVVLLAYAEVAATLTGFIGVVFVFGERSHRLGGEQYSALFHLMYSSLSALFLSLFATLMLVHFAADEHLAWRICNALSGIIHLIGGGRLALETRAQKTEVRSSAIASTIGLGTAAVSLMAAAGYLARQEALIFMLATLWVLGVTVISFVSLLVSASKEPTDQAG